MTAQSDTKVAAFSGKLDLAQKRLGGEALLASDEFFAAKENLLLAGRGEFQAGQFDAHGQVYSGWETRRNRTQGHTHDWCIVKLGCPGEIYGVDIDTNHFLGNHPPYATLEACEYDGDPQRISTATWHTVLERSLLHAGSRNLFAVKDSRRWTHVRLNIFPDGGVARLRIYGEPRPDWSKISRDTLIDLVAAEHGGRSVCASDMFYSDPANMLMPGRGVNMGDGWETRRRRGPGNEWCVIKLGVSGTVEKVEIDTNHFKGNYPDRFQLEGLLTNDSIDALNAHAAAWKLVVPETKLSAHQVHVISDVKNIGPISHLRLSIYPCGGVSRLRVFGKRTA